MVAVVQAIRERAAGRYRVVLTHPDDEFWLISIYLPGCPDKAFEELAYNFEAKALEAFNAMQHEGAVNEILFPNAPPPAELLEPGSSEYWRAHDADVKLARKTKEEIFLNALQSADIGYVSKNDGAHLMINYKGIRVDLYPTKGGWRLSGHGRNRLTYGEPQQFIRWMNNRAAEGDRPQPAKDSKRNRNRNRRKA